MLKRLTEYLDGHGIQYVVITHSVAYTAEDIALSAHVPEKGLAKSVMALIDGRMTMIVLPASAMIDFTRLRHQMGAVRSELATESSFKELFPECMVGAMPPFGNLFGVPVVVDGSLGDNEEITFNAGTHRELVKMRYKDFESLVRPTLFSFAIRRHAQPYFEYE